MRVLVTGAFGYVGHAVARALLDDGHEVVALTSQSPVPAWDGGGVEIVRADVTDRAMLRDRGALAGVDAVCHLAALTRVRESFERAQEYSTTNTMGTLNLIKLLAETGCRIPFVHASTAAVYGAPDVQPIDELCQPAPASPYASSKLAADLLLEKATVDGTLSGVSLRIFNAAGTIDGRCDPDLTRIIAKAVAVAGGRFPEVTVNGDGSAVRDYVHVADVARAFVLALGHAAPGRYDAFNVGATPATVAQILDVARNVTGHPIPAVHDPPAPEAPELRADTAKIRDVLGWEPQRSSLEQIVGDTWAARQRHEDPDN